MLKHLSGTKYTVEVYRIIRIFCSFTAPVYFSHSLTTPCKVCGPPQLRVLQDPKHGAARVFSLSPAKSSLIAPYAIFTINQDLLEVIMAVP